MQEVRVGGRGDVHAVLPLDVLVVEHGFQQQLLHWQLLGW